MAQFDAVLGDDDLASLAARCNAALPSDVRVLEVRAAQRDFNAMQASGAAGSI